LSGRIVPSVNVQSSAVGERSRGASFPTASTEKRSAIRTVLHWRTRAPQFIAAEKACAPARLRSMSSELGHGRMVLETPRLILRELVPEDEDALAAMFADPEVMRWIGTGGIRTRQHAREVIEKQLREYREHGYGEWATILRGPDELIGLCGLIRWQDIDGVEETEVAYLLARHAWGHGYATEAAVAIRDWAIRKLGRDRLVSLTYHDNVASMNVARKNGMSWEKDVTFKGVTLALYALTRLGKGSPDKPKERDAT